MTLYGYLLQALRISSSISLVSSLTNLYIIVTYCILLSFFIIHHSWEAYYCYLIYILFLQFCWTWNCLVAIRISLLSDILTEIMRHTWLYSHFQFMDAIFDLPQTLLWESSHVSSTVLLDHENVKVAVGISLLSYILTEVYGIVYPLSVHGPSLITWSSYNIRNSLFAFHDLENFRVAVRILLMYTTLLR